VHYQNPRETTPWCLIPPAGEDEIPAETPTGWAPTQSHSSGREGAVTHYGTWAIALLRGGNTVRQRCWSCQPGSGVKPTGKPTHPKGCGRNVLLGSRAKARKCGAALILFLSWSVDEEGGGRQMGQGARSIKWAGWTRTQNAAN